MIIGIDEVGRGCWAGPLVAAAVGLEDSHNIVGLADSKKLSKKLRENIDQQIRSETKQIGIGWVWPKEINKFGLTKSVKLAMQRAVDQIELVDYKIIIDGNINYLKKLPNTESIIRADGQIDCVSAASIIAKVARDEYMEKISKEYPNYHFEKHVGYGTALHIRALETHGITPIHRTSYKPIQELISKNNDNLKFI